MDTMIKSLARKFAVETPHWTELIFPIFVSIAFLLSRKICEKQFSFMAAAMKVRNPRRPRPQPLEVLDSASKAVADIVSVHFQVLTGLPLKFSHGARTPTQKFSRAGWFFMYYIQSWLIAYYIFHQETWLWDTSSWWYNYPYQVVTTDCWLYYMVSMAFSWSLILPQVGKMPPKLTATLLTHSCRVIFMSVSWMCGFYRITTALVFVEDFSNLLREATKLMNYLKLRTMYRIFLPVYIIVWAYTHLVFFQFWVLRSVYTESPEPLQDSPLCYIYGPLFVYMLAVRYYTAVLLLRGLLK